MLIGCSGFGRGGEDAVREAIRIRTEEEGAAAVGTPREERAKVPQAPGRLEPAIVALEKDHEFLLKGDVFTMDFIDMWVAAKRKEHDALRLRPHPYEFFLYYDV